MQFVIIIIFFTIWLIILWVGSVILERTGLDRTKARFQALSALTGTGFTTGEAELIVNHPKRRKITTWLIFIGNTGIIAFIILMILYLRSGLITPSLIQIVVIVGIIIAIFLMIKLKAVDRLTDIIMRLPKTNKVKNILTTAELLYRNGDYGISRIFVDEGDISRGFTLQDTIFSKRGITILAIERGTTILPFPEVKVAVQAGDYLLCYGKLID